MPLGFQVSVPSRPLPGSLFLRQICPPVYLEVNSGQDSCQIEEGGCVKQMKESGWLSFLVSSLLCFPPWHSKALRPCPWPTPEIPAPSDTAPEVAFLRLPVLSVPGVWRKALPTS